MALVFRSSLASAPAGTYPAASDLGVVDVSRDGFSLWETMPARKSSKRYSVAIAVACWVSGSSRAAGAAAEHCVGLRCHLCGGLFRPLVLRHLDLHPGVCVFLIVWFCTMSLTSLAQLRSEAVATPLVVTVDTTAMEDAGQPSTSLPSSCRTHKPACTNHDSRIRPHHRGR